MKEVSLSADGTRAAVAILVHSEGYGAPLDEVQGRFFVLDTTTMAVVPGPAADGFDVTSVGVRVGGAAISPDGTQVYFGAQDGDPEVFELQVVDVATGAISAVPGSPALDSDTTDLKFGPDGRLYWAQGAADALNIFDPAAGAWTTSGALGVDLEPWSVEFNRRNYYVVDHDGERSHRFGYNDDAVAPAAAVPTDVDGTIAMPDVNESHTELVTPF
jgi:hypothetical protein